MNASYQILTQPLQVIDHRNLSVWLLQKITKRFWKHYRNVLTQDCTDTCKLVNREGPVVNQLSGRHLKKRASLISKWNFKDFCPSSLHRIFPFCSLERRYLTKVKERESKKERDNVILWGHHQCGQSFCYEYPRKPSKTLKAKTFHISKFKER